MAYRLTYKVDYRKPHLLPNWWAPLHDEFQLAQHRDQYGDGHDEFQQFINDRFGLDITLKRTAMKRGPDKEEWTFPSEEDCLIFLIKCPYEEFDWVDRI